MLYRHERLWCEYLMSLPQEEFDAYLDTLQQEELEYLSWILGEVKGEALEDILASTDDYKEAKEVIDRFKGVDNNS
jgi:hypothetical protein